ncbi:MAG TPA: hypothetical protein VH701_05455 [Vicinamibacterales bacterium]|jgi:hypothetical protein
MIGRTSGSPTLQALATVWLVLNLGVVAFAQDQDNQTSPGEDDTGSTVLSFLGGAAAGLGAHEAGHLLFGAILGADPSIKAVDFGGIPFFALTHRPDLSPRREFTVSAAGFWMQHATSELVLTRHPRLRDEHEPFRKGVLAFNVLTSVGYSAAAMAKAGPYERDTRAIGDALELSERWVGVMVLAPAVLDAYRYFKPDSRWAAWSSRAMKVGWVILVLK